MTKLCIEIKSFNFKNTFCATWIKIDFQDIGWNNEIGKLLFFDIHIVGIVSLVKIGMPHLGLAQNLYSSARAGKFQLELITTK